MNAETFIILGVLYLVIMETIFQVCVKLGYKNGKMDSFDFGLLKVGSMFAAGFLLGVNYMLLAMHGIKIFAIFYAIIFALVMVIYANWKYMKSKGKIE